MKIYKFILLEYYIRCYLISILCCSCKNKYNYIFVITNIGVPLNKYVFIKKIVLIFSFKVLL